MRYFGAMISVPNIAMSALKPFDAIAKMPADVAVSRAPKLSEAQKEVIDRLNQSKDTAKTALSGLQNSNAEARAAKKADALRRFQELNKRMMALKKAFGGDPKFLAKTLNAIAKELKQVVKDYKDAIGDKPSNSPNIQSAGLSQAQLAEDEVKNIEKSERLGEIVEKSPEMESAVAKVEAKQVETKQSAELNSEANEAEQTPKVPPLDAIRAYANSLMTDEHAQFMRGVRKMIDEIKHYSGLFKAQIKFAGSDKEGEKIMNEGDEAFKDLFTETASLQMKLNNPNMSAGNFVALSA